MAPGAPGVTIFTISQPCVLNSSAASTRQMSLPGPPLTTRSARPSTAFKRSAPRPPESRSRPGPPASRSLPAPPESRSLPPRPLMRSLPPRELITSAFAVPTILSAPLLPDIRFACAGPAEASISEARAATTTNAMDRLPNRRNCRSSNSMDTSVTWQTAVRRLASCRWTAVARAQLVDGHALLHAHHLTSPRGAASAGSHASLVVVGASGSGGAPAVTVTVIATMISRATGWLDQAGWRHAVGQPGAWRYGQPDMPEPKVQGPTAGGARTSPPSSSSINGLVWSLVHDPDSARAPGRRPSVSPVSPAPRRDPVTRARRTALGVILP